jgi:hypothetical protein
MEAQPQNPFGRRGRVTAEELFNREPELGLLRRYLTNGISCQVVAPSGYGKSSLLFALRQLAPEWDERLTVGYIDLQKPHCHTLEGFMQCVWAELKEPPAAPTLLALSERVEELAKKGRRPVLCLDEFGELTRRPEVFTTDFFLEMRSIAQTGMTIVTASPEPLRTLLPSDNPVSPFFNIFAMLRLGPFSPVVAEQFLLKERPGVPPFDEAERRVILDFAKGYPLSLQVASFYVLEAKLDGTSLAEAIKKAEDDLSQQAA